jgi:hypothetical protein
MGTTARAGGRRGATPATHRLVIAGWHPAKLNQLLNSHWAARGRVKKLDRDLVTVCARMAGTPRAKGKRRVSLVLTLAPGQRAGDPDCYWKSLLDALVHAGLLGDDSPRWCELGTVGFVRGEARATTITLEDLAT